MGHGPKMTKVRSIPRVQTEVQTILSPTSKCGDNWDRPVKIRAPYRGQDSAFRVLPSLGHKDQVESFDPLFLSEIEGDIDRVKSFIDSNRTTLSSRQISNAEIMIQRASDYREAGALISALWSSGFTTRSAGTVQSLPLGSQLNSGIEPEVLEGHQRDEIAYKKLIIAALKNLRCAEEFVKKATIRNRNKEKKLGRRFGNVVAGFTPMDPPPSGSLDPLPSGSLDEPDPSDPGNGLGPALQGTVTPFDPEPDLEDGDIDLGGDEDLEPEGSATTSAKKKSNSALIFGAAALGLLALKGK